MILFHHIIQIFHLTDNDRGAVVLIVAADGRRIGLAAINGDLLRDPMAANRLGEEAFGGLLVAFLRQEKIDGLAGLVAA
jgi:hypothetical protein